MGMGPCHPNPSTCRVMPIRVRGHRAVVRLILRLSLSERAQAPCARPAVLIQQPSNGSRHRAGARATQADR